MPPAVPSRSRSNLFLPLHHAVALDEGCGFKKPWVAVYATSGLLPSAASSIYQWG